MKCLIFAVLAIAMMVENSDSKPVSKYQDLPKKAGYVPVYIRVGNTPLEQINRDLARAFQEANARSIRGTMIQELNHNARFSSESSSISSEEANNIIPKIRSIDNRSISSESNSNSSESNSSELLLDFVRAKPSAISNNVV
ncbi:uncharacterized protein LOC134213206 isoform X1 [Armigeres subalbatus]|uniref:uncharacterized protein LOC134203648 isoform X1 n=1 Tax=Armigeres subalbatus TaxID=124917 RepID=UPI002ED59924